MIQIEEDKKAFRATNSLRVLLSVLTYGLKVKTFS